VRRRERQLLAGILFLALGIRCALFVGAAGVDPLDDIHYLDLAQQINTGTSFRDLLEEHSDPDGARLATDAFFLRRGAYYPAAWSQRLLGHGEIQAALPALFASLATILVVYRIGSMLVDARSAAWGAFVYAIAPVDVAYASRVGVEALQLFWASCSIALALDATAKERSASRGLWTAAGSGVCLYLAYATRITAVLFVPVLILIAIRSHRRFTGAATVLVFLVVLGLEGLFFFGETGSFTFLFDYERAAQTGVLARQPEALFYPLPHVVAHFSYLTTVPHHFFKLFWGTIEHFGGLKLFSSLALVGVLAAFYSLLRRDAREPILLLWLLSIFLFFQYGFIRLGWDSDTSTLHYYLPVARPRYLLLLLPALALLVGRLFRDVWQRRPILGVVLAVLLGGTCILDSVRNRRFYRESLADMRSAASFLVENLASYDDVFVDRWGRDEIAFLSGYRIVPKLYEGSLPQGSLFVIGGSRGFGLDSNYIADLYRGRLSRLHVRSQAPPDGFRLLHEREAPTHVARETNLRIYRVDVDVSRME
jgi:hypothetical protein